MSASNPARTAISVLEPIQNNQHGTRQANIFSAASDLPWWITLTSQRRQSVSSPGNLYRIIKRSTDLLAIVIASPVLLLMFAICFVAIKLDSPRGPVLFRQMRTGQDGKRFELYKFRTMVVNSEELKEKYRHLNELAWPDFKVTNDPRITRVGRFLRKTSLDELPQIWNVVQGKMSLVGPRPTSFSATTYEPWQTIRLEVVPGLTGLWQILGRGEMEFADRVRLDYEYIVRQSFVLDMVILLNTLGVLWRGK